MVAIAAPAPAPPAVRIPAGARIWPWVRVLGGAAILGIAAWKLGTGSIVDGLRAVNVLSVAAALLIGFGTTVLCALRWRIVAERLGTRFPLRPAVGHYYRAQLLNNVLPAGVLGDVHRAVTHGVPAVVVERSAGQLVVVVAAMGAIATGPALGGLTGCLLIGVGVMAAALVVGWLLLRKERRSALGGVLPPVLGLSAAALAGHLTLFVIAAHATGVTASVGQLAPLLIIALLAMGLPLNVAGWGPREGATAVLFGAAGLGSGAGLSTSVAYGVLSLIASLPGLLVLRRKTRSSRAGS
ncbi:lysylphosphatidylglycerol synthase transmembrane domain-containing protein [Labedaea rhizosphaerae]|uniref:Lysylphosphatidylglycerol synthase-like protein n=1 Tax=Labedaea rhizosphaerae TaxID=598644 RepID=A0A4R6RXT9_LABRH|nr:lysylphosphatidylglycerol synthase transmembrane domain-containing protein [Labedaea rhizosphaerae]TDP91016.1 lysylphosphatidylglycerol synthase-like protein [Labedaea rhizosphaerae]